MSKRPCFRTPFGSQRLPNTAGICVKAVLSILSSLWGKLNLEMSLIQIWNLKLFVNTLTPNYVFSSWHSKKNFCQIFIAFLKYTLNFKYFKQKDEPQSWSFSKIVDSKRCPYLNVWRVLFQNFLRQSVWRNISQAPEIGMTALSSCYSIILR